jgi:hypothetical protein
VKISSIDGWLTLDGAAGALGTTRWAVYHFIRRHHIPTHRIGKSHLVRLVDLSGMRRARRIVS